MLGLLQSLKTMRHVDLTIKTQALSKYNANLKK